MSAAAAGPRTSTSTRGGSPNQRPSGAPPLVRTGWPPPTTSWPAPPVAVSGLEHTPPWAAENALPAAGAAGEHEESCIAVGVRRRQHADARPVSVAETSGTVLAGVERCVDREGKKEEDENSDQHFSNGVAHGFGMRPGFGTEI